MLVTVYREVLEVQVYFLETRRVELVTVAV